jgi:flavin reductase (DIM6/NTAB) family NADH-FMN oxidoreductase RutF
MNESNRISLDPSNLSQKDCYRLLIGSVVPRPIALVSTISPEGVSNLAPFSSYNLVSSKPTCISFSIANDQAYKTKDTLRNLRSLPELTVNSAHLELLDQVALAGYSFDSTVSEFSETKLNPLASTLVRPCRVAESLIQMECTVYKTVEIGDGGAGSATLIIAEVLRIHLAEQIYKDGRINHEQLSALSRLAGSLYAEVGKVHQAKHNLKQ